MKGDEEDPAFGIHHVVINGSFNLSPHLHSYASKPLSSLSFRLQLREALATIVNRLVLLFVCLHVNKLSELATGWTALITSSTIQHTRNRGLGHGLIYCCGHYDMIWSTEGNLLFLYRLQRVCWAVSIETATPWKQKIKICTSWKLPCESGRRITVLVQIDGIWIIL